MNTRILSITGLVILGAALFFGGLFWGRSQENALGFYPGSMMNSGFSATQDGAINMPQNSYSATNGSYGMMAGGGMMGGQYNSGMMGGFGSAPDAEPLSAPQPAAPQTTNSGDWEAVSFYAAACASCHGPTGGGTAIAPVLNGVNIQTAEAEWLMDTISNGRAGTAMPAWSMEFGGSLNSDQIANMAAFLQAGDWEKAGEIASEQPFSPMGPGMMGRGMGGGMMGRGRGNDMDNGMGYGRNPN